MISRPVGLNGFEFAVLASLRAHQLMSGCIPQVTGDHKKTMIAQMEVAAGKVMRLIPPAGASPAIADGHGLPAITEPELELAFVPME